MLLTGLVVVACAVLLPNLGDRCLWQDEAECALPAKGVLRTGLPVAWDGRLLTTQEHGEELTDSFLWAWTPWAMHYFAAAGMAVFGSTSLGARLPFALLGCASIGLTYVVARRLVQDRWTSCLAAVLLVSCVQYLLLMRQCRYYGIVPAAALLAVWGYTDLHRRRGLILLTAGMVLLFHANYATCLCFALGLAVHMAIWRRDRKTLVRLAIAAAVAAALTLPWYFGLGMHHVFAKSRALGYKPDPFGQTTFKLMFVINQFACPMVVVLGLVIAAVARRLRVRGGYGLVACMAVGMMIVPVFLWANPRYVMHMLALGPIVVAAAVREVHLRNVVVGYVLAVVATATNLLPAATCVLFPADVGTSKLNGEYVTGRQVLAQSVVKKEWAGYVHELHTPFVGPNEAIVRFLNEQTEPNDILFAAYGDLPIMFHTHRRCAGLLAPSSRRRPGWDRLPDYLWDLDAASVLVVRPWWQVPGGYQALYHRWEEKARRSGQELARRVLPVQDIRWGNSPGPRYHCFRSPGPKPGFNVMLIRRQPRQED